MMMPTNATRPMLPSVPACVTSASPSPTTAATITTANWWMRFSSVMGGRFIAQRQQPNPRPRCARIESAQRGQRECSNSTSAYNHRYTQSRKVKVPPPALRFVAAKERAQSSQGSPKVLGDPAHGGKVERCGEYEGHAEYLEVTPAQAGDLVVLEAGAVVDGAGGQCR
jgi:hypothetical protein